MVDYAENVVREDVNVSVAKETAASKAVVWVPFGQLGFVLVAALLIYIIGYQNSTISRAKHGINLKRSRLIQLNLKLDTVEAMRARAMNSNAVIADAENKKMKVAKDIQIVY